MVSREHVLDRLDEVIPLVERVVGWPAYGESLGVLLMGVDEFKALCGEEARAYSNQIMEADCDDVIAAYSCLFSALILIEEKIPQENGLLDAVLSHEVSHRCQLIAHPWLEEYVRPALPSEDDFEWDYVRGMWTGLCEGQAEFVTRWLSEKHGWCDPSVIELTEYEPFRRTVEEYHRSSGSEGIQSLYLLPVDDLAKRIWP